VQYSPPPFLQSVATVCQFDFFIWWDKIASWSYLFHSFWLTCSFIKPTKCIYDTHNNFESCMLWHIILPCFKLVSGLPWWWQSYMLKHVGVKKIVHLVDFINRQRKLYHRLKCEWCNYEVIHYFIWACYRWKCFCDMKAIIQVYIVYQIIKSLFSAICEKHAIKYFGSTAVIWKVSFFHYNCVRHVFFFLWNHSNFYQPVFFILGKFHLEVSLVKLVFELWHFVWHSHGEMS